MLATLVVCALSSKLTPKELQEKFATWEKENNPNGVPQSSYLRKQHFDAFTVSANYVEEHNLEGSDWVAGLNAFSGMVSSKSVEANSGLSFIFNNITKTLYFRPKVKKLNIAD